MASPYARCAWKRGRVRGPVLSGMANGDAVQGSQAMHVDLTTTEPCDRTKDTDLPCVSGGDPSVTARPPPTPTPSALQQRRATLSAKTRSNSRRQSVLQQELESRKEPEAHNDEERELGRVMDAPEDTQSQHRKRSAQPQAEDRGRAGGSGSGGKVAPRASQNLSESAKLEDQINLQHLVELMRIFHEADENGSDGLDIDEFRSAFGQILGKGKNDPQMAILFMKIDTNCDGTVDWDEFCTFMLLEYQEKDIMAGESLPPFPYPVKVLHSPHRDMINRITFLPNLNRRSQDTQATPSLSSGSGDVKHELDGRYLSVCRDGTLCFWKNDFSLQRIIHLDANKPRLTWVTDMVVMPNSNKVTLSYTDNLISVYDLTTAMGEGQFQIVAFPYCILAMDYWYDPKDMNRAVLVMGDSGGGVIVMEFSSAVNCLFGVPTSKQVGNLRISFLELVHHKPDGVIVTHIPKVHGDWVYKVKYCPSMEHLMSCSGDSNSSLYRGDLRGRKEASLFKVRKGVVTFDYCKDWNIIATGGLDRAMRIWNPYVTAKPIAVLKGHSATIMHIAINSSLGQVLSFSKDMELRVWDIQDQLCLQACHRFQSLAPQLPSAFYLHPVSGTILIGTNQLGVLEPLHDDDRHIMRGDVLSHDKPLCGALYNLNFNQVVSACHGSMVSVWDVDTGEKTIQFSQCHGNQEITAMAFDTTGRRLITGGRDGLLKIWNFNNGACLSILDSKNNAEVTCIAFTKQRIIVGGWSRMLALYGDTREEQDIVPKYFGAGKHKDDILCMAYQEPKTLVSASYDGDIVVWNVNAERVICKLNSSEGAAQLRCAPAAGKNRGTQDLKPSSKSTLVENEPKEAKNTQQCTGRQKRTKDERAIEKVVLLQTRQASDQESASLVACGAGGWVDFWNIHGGGLVGEFNVWDSSRLKLEREARLLESVTALRVDSQDSVLITGNSMGYLQIWDISEYCVHVPTASRPVTQPPPLQLAWRGHLSSVVSVDLAEDRGLIITASTDCCVRLWTMNGRFIGTFGEKVPWHLTYPIRPSDLPRKAPPGINRVSSFWTMQIVAGPCTSKWTLARNLFRVLRRSRKERDLATQDEDHTHPYNTGDPAKSHILGKFYQRKTRFRRPIVPAKLRHADGGRLYGVYNTLKCSDIHEPQLCDKSTSPLHMPGSIEDGLCAAGPLKTDLDNNMELPKLEHTEASLLPMIPQCNPKKTNTVIP